MSILSVASVFTKTNLGCYFLFLKKLCAWEHSTWYSLAGVFALLSVQVVKLYACVCECVCVCEYAHGVWSQKNLKDSVAGKPLGN